jgi:hypothetical protein
MIYDERRKTFLKKDAVNAMGEGGTWRTNGRNGYSPS